MSDTPRTDKDCFDSFKHPLTEQNCEVVQADFARTLERELAAERAKVDRLREALECAGTMTSYAHEDDSVGQRMCCGVPSFWKHDKDCWLIAALKDTQDG